MKNISFFVILLLLTLLGCKKDYPTVISTAFDVWVRDNDGNNLFNTQTPNHYSVDTVRIFYLENGVRKEFNNPMLGAPRNFLVMKNESNGEYGVRLFPYEGTHREGTATTRMFIQWNYQDTDTVDCAIEKYDATEICTKVWWNGVLKFDRTTASTTTWGNAQMFRFFEVKK